MKKIISGFAAVFMAFSLIITQTGCSEKSEPVEKTSYYMDTVCSITVYDMENMSGERAEKAIDGAFSLCAEYEALLSATKEGTDVYRINHAGGEPVECDPRTVDVIEMGIKYGDLSEGKFDITIGKVTDLWDFHTENPRIPSEDETQSALASVDYKQIRIEDSTVTMENPDGEINLGGIGKGYIADRAGEYLEEQGVTSAIVNFGGNIVAIGDRDGDDFRIGIEKPFSDRSEIVGVVTVKDATVVTSGIYERCFEQDGRLYHHILDVNTGYPADTDVASVTLIAESGMSGDCDAMSTICLMLGVSAGTEFIENTEGVEAVFIDRDGNITKTSGADNFTEE